MGKVNSKHGSYNPQKNGKEKSKEVPMRITYLPEYQVYEDLRRYSTPTLHETKTVELSQRPNSFIETAKEYHVAQSNYPNLSKGKNSKQPNTKQNNRETNNYQTNHSKTSNPGIINSQVTNINGSDVNAEVIRIKDKGEEELYYSIQYEKYDNENLKVADTDQESRKISINNKEPTLATLIEKSRQESGKPVVIQINEHIIQFDAHEEDRNQNAQANRQSEDSLNQDEGFPKEQQRRESNESHLGNHPNNLEPPEIRISFSEVEEMKDSISSYEDHIYEEVAKYKKVENNFPNAFWEPQMVSSNEDIYESIDGEGSVKELASYSNVACHSLQTDFRAKTENLTLDLSPVIDDTSIFKVHYQKIKYGDEDTDSDSSESYKSCLEVISPLAPHEFYVDYSKPYDAESELQSLSTIEEESEDDNAHRKRPRPVLSSQIVEEPVYAQVMKPTSLHPKEVQHTYVYDNLKIGSYTRKSGQMKDENMIGEEIKDYVNQRTEEELNELLREICSEFLFNEKFYWAECEGENKERESEKEGIEKIRVENEHDYTEDKEKNYPSQYLLLIQDICIEFLLYERLYSNQVNDFSVIQKMDVNNETFSRSSSFSSTEGIYDEVGPNPLKNEHHLKDVITKNEEVRTGEGQLPGVQAAEVHYKEVQDAEVQNADVQNAQVQIAEVQIAEVQNAENESEGEADVEFESDEIFGTTEDQEILKYFQNICEIFLVNERRQGLLFPFSPPKSMNDDPNSSIHEDYIEIKKELSHIIAQKEATPDTIVEDLDQVQELSFVESLKEVGILEYSVLEERPDLEGSSRLEFVETIDQNWEECEEIEESQYYQIIREICSEFLKYERWNTLDSDEVEKMEDLWPDIWITGDQNYNHMSIIDIIHEVNEDTENENEVKQEVHKNIEVNIEKVHDDRLEVNEVEHEINEEMFENSSNYQRPEELIVLLKVCFAFLEIERAHSSCLGTFQSTTDCQTSELYGFDENKAKDLQKEESVNFKKHESQEYSSGDELSNAAPTIFTDLQPSRSYEKATSGKTRDTNLQETISIEVPIKTTLSEKIDTFLKIERTYHSDSNVNYPKTREGEFAKLPDLVNDPNVTYDTVYVQGDLTNQTVDTEQEGDNQAGLIVHQGDLKGHFEEVLRIRENVKRIRKCVETDDSHLYLKELLQEMRRLNTIFSESFNTELLALQQNALVEIQRCLSYIQTIKKS